MNPRACLVGCIVWAASFTVSGQAPPNLTSSQQSALLQIAGSFYQVSKYATVDIDSGMMAASRSLGIPLLPVITEAVPEAIPSGLSDWVGRANPAEATALLPALTGRARLQLLYLLGGWYAFQSNVHHTSMDLAIGYLTLAREESRRLSADEWTRRCDCLLGKACIEKGDTTAGNAWFRQSIDACRRAGDFAGEAVAWKDWAVYYPLSPTTGSQRIACGMNALDCYSRAKDPFQRANMLMDIGYLNFSIVKIAEAKPAFTAALALQDSLHWPYTHYTTDILAMMSTIEYQYDVMLRYALRSVKSSEATGDSLGQAVFYIRMADVYNGEDIFQNEYIYWANKAVDRLLVSGGESMIYQNAMPLIHTMLGKNRPVEARALIEKLLRLYPPDNIKDSLDYHLMMCSYAITTHDTAGLAKYAEVTQREEERMGETRPYMLGMGDRILGDLLFNRRQYRSAEPHLRSYIVSGAGRQRPESVLGALRMLLHIDTVLGNFQSGVRDFAQYMTLDSAVFSSTQARQVDLLKVQYETEEKEKDIQLLQSRARLNERRLQQVALVRSVAIGGVLVLLVISGLLYNRYRLKKRGNELLQQQKEEIEWLLKELHHRVKNNLQVMMSLQNLQVHNLTSEEAVNAVTDSNNRLYAMSLIHQKLYQPDSRGMIDMRSYIAGLVRHLSDALSPDRPVKVETPSANIELDVAQAIPVGLFLNETITNAYKYAFTAAAAAPFPGPADSFPGPGAPFAGPADHADIGPAPCILIDLQPTGRDGELEVTVRDNGKGYSPVEQGRRTSLGFQLMEMLAKQLRGKLVIFSENGLVVKLRFPIIPVLLPLLLVLTGMMARAQVSVEAQTLAGDSTRIVVFRTASESSPVAAFSICSGKDNFSKRGKLSIRNNFGQ